MRRRVITRPVRRAQTCGIALWLLAACSPPGADLRPATGLLLISVDTLRADRLGAYGYPRPTSPQIDGLASGGTLFTRASASSPWTIPSHMSLITGLYPHRHGVTAEQLRLPQDVPTLADLLRDRGFRTRAVVSSMHLTSGADFPRGFEELEYVSEWDLDEGRRLPRNPGPEVTREALAALDELAGDPFFLFLHYYDVHSDYAPAPRFREGLVDAYSGKANGSTPLLSAFRKGAVRIGERGRRHLSQLYDAEIRQLDAQLGRVLAHLEQAGVADSTLVILTSDHGEEFFEHGSVLHGRTYFEEVIRVPLLLRGPGVPAGHRVDELASLVDVVPTALGLLGLPIPEALQGLDLSVTWREGTRPGREAILAESDRGLEVPGRYRMLRTDRHKLVLDTRQAGTRIYDLQADPKEMQPVTDPGLLRSLSQRLEAMTEQPRRAPSGPALSPEQLEMLRRLGYGDEGAASGPDPSR